MHAPCLYGDPTRGISCGAGFRGASRCGSSLLKSSLRGTGEAGEAGGAANCRPARRKMTCLCVECRSSPCGSEWKERNTRSASLQQLCPARARPQIFQAFDFEPLLEPNSQPRLSCSTRHTWCMETRSGMSVDPRAEYMFIYADSKRPQTGG